MLFNPAIPSIRRDELHTEEARRLAALPRGVNVFDEAGVFRFHLSTGAPESEEDELLVENAKLVIANEQLRTEIAAVTRERDVARVDVATLEAANKALRATGNDGGTGGRRGARCPHGYLYNLDRDPTGPSDRRAADGCAPPLDLVRVQVAYEAVQQAAYDLERVMENRISGDSADLAANLSNLAGDLYVLLCRRC